MMMEFGCHLPIYGSAASRDVVIPFARRMEALGYESLWVSDHLVIPYRIQSRYPYNETGEFPMPPTTDWLEPLTVLGLVAGVTERIRLGTTVLVLPHRHPLLLAKMLATLDRLAPGRVILGAGVGWMREEIELFGVPYARRGKWSDEAIRVLRTCWQDERSSFAGEFFRIPEVGAFPKPGGDGIPIWIGGHTPAALRRVAELGDGWHAAFTTPETLPPALDRLRAACQGAGRDFASVTITVRMGLSARRPADELIGELKALHDLGVAHVIFESRMRDLAEMTALYERFATEVRPRLQA
jgi:probable F420-dependent oxidoreductase